MQIVKDVTKERKKKSPNQERGHPKVLEKDIASRALARISKQAVFKAICFVNMFPEDKMFAWDVLEAEILNKKENVRRDLSHDLRFTQKDDACMEDLLDWVKSFYSFTGVLLNLLFR